MNLNSIQHQEHVYIYCTDESKFNCVFRCHKHKLQHCKTHKIRARKKDFEKFKQIFFQVFVMSMFYEIVLPILCFKCKSKHHILISDEKNRTRDHSSKSLQQQSLNTAEINTQTYFNDTPFNMMLQTAVVNVYVSNKSEIRAFRLLFDSGTRLVASAQKQEHS